MERETGERDREIWTRISDVSDIKREKKMGRRRERDRGTEKQMDGQIEWKMGTRRGRKREIENHGSPLIQLPENRILSLRGGEQGKEPHAKEEGKN